MSDRLRLLGLVSALWASLLFTGCLIPVGPDPLPPEPDPAPHVVTVVDRLQLVAVFDKAAASPELAAFYADLDYWDSLQSRGHSRVVLDSDNEWAVKNKAASPIGYPCEFVFDLKTKKKLAVVPLPQDRESQNAVIKTYSGK